MQRRTAYQLGTTVPNLAAMANRKRGLMSELDERDAESDWKLDLVERDASEHYLEFMERDLELQKQAITKRALSKRDLFVRHSSAPHPLAVPTHYR